jgi:translation initiation factor IF-3
LIAEDGAQLGVNTIQDALRIAQEQGKDLVEIAPLATPPVCKIIDFSKLKYEMEKKAREAKKKQKATHLKEIRLRPKIGEHDLLIKINHAREFIEAGDKVQVSVMFMGRENQHRDLGHVLAKRIIEMLSDVALVERNPQQFGNRLIMYLIPKKSVKV